MHDHCVTDITNLLCAKHLAAAAAAAAMMLKTMMLTIRLKRRPAAVAGLAATVQGRSRRWLFAGGTGLLRPEG